MWHHAITLQPALGLCGRHVREFDNVEKYFSTPPEIKTLSQNQHQMDSFVCKDP